MATTKEDRIFADYKANKNNGDYEEIWLTLARRWKLPCSTIKEIVRSKKQPQPEQKPDVIEPFQNDLTRMLRKIGFVVSRLTRKGYMWREVNGMAFEHPAYGDSVEIIVYKDQMWEYSIVNEKGQTELHPPQKFTSKNEVRAILEPTVLKPLFRLAKIAKAFAEMDKEGTISIDSDDSLVVYVEDIGW